MISTPLLMMINLNLTTYLFDFDNEEFKSYDGVKEYILKTLNKKEKENCKY